jgi:hypothetical protein
MSDVMCIVTNHGENQAGLLFRVDSARLFVMSDVIFNVIVRDCRQCCPWYTARMVGSGRPTTPLPSTSRARYFTQHLTKAFVTQILFD